MRTDGKEQFEFKFVFTINFPTRKKYLNSSSGHLLLGQFANNIEGLNFIRGRIFKFFSKTFNALS